MKIINTSVRLKGKEKHNCQFCDKVEASYLLRTSDLMINKTIDINYVCSSCKEKLDYNQINECSECGRLKKNPTQKCLCVYMKENGLALEDNSDSDDYNPLEL